MSFARLALRIATVKALRGRTWAEEQVRDSEIGPIDDAADGASKPFVVVYTDDCEGPADADPTSLFVSGSTVALTIEIGVTTRMKSEWGIPTTDAGMELTIDSIERQARAALADPESSWAEMWRALALAITHQKSQRGAAAKDGVRFAARQIVLTVEVPRDPLPGQPVNALWQRFLTLAAADPDLSGQVALLTALATGGATDWPDLKVLRAGYGLSSGTARAMLLAPPTGAAPEYPVFAPGPITQVTVALPPSFEMTVPPIPPEAP